MFGVCMLSKQGVWLTMLMFFSWKTHSRKMIHFSTCSAKLTSGRTIIQIPVISTTAEWATLTLHIKCHTLLLLGHAISWAVTARNGPCVLPVHWAGWTSSVRSICARSSPVWAAWCIVWGGRCITVIARITLVDVCCHNYLLHLGFARLGKNGGFMQSLNIGNIRVFAKNSLL